MGCLVKPSYKDDFSLYFGFTMQTIEKEDCEFLGRRGAKQKAQAERRDPAEQARAEARRPAAAREEAAFHRLCLNRYKVEDALQTKLQHLPPGTTYSFGHQGQRVLREEVGKGSR
jgi:hypothetical protein